MQNGKAIDEKGILPLALAGVLATTTPSATPGKTRNHIEQPAETQRHLDQIVVAKTLYGEAQGEGEQGMRAVATVVWNRARQNPDELVKVCKEPNQFSCWNDGRVGIKDRASFAVAQDIAAEMFNGTFSPYPFQIENPIYYCTTELYKSKIPKHMRNRETEVVGNHIFSAGNVTEDLNFATFYHMAMKRKNEQNKKRKRGKLKGTYKPNKSEKLFSRVPGPRYNPQPWKTDAPSASTFMSKG